MATEELTGVTEMEVSVAAVTTRVALAVIEPEVTVIIVEPPPAAVATPEAEPMLAALVLLELQTAPGGADGGVEEVVFESTAVAVNVTVCGTPVGAIRIVEEG